ncbi:MAG: type II toxin-antitoxin system HipA family toxin [Planctomycetes bacterium]|nr:type II toxin-antitoxin system HipA family toxin [Planctomycetota bacterium]MCC7169130.1 type II toxin-antitoxin system HipA family toxin [Planctomycetota bacterium]
MTTVAEVKLWGRRIGAVSVEGPGQVASFQFTPEFGASGIEVAPLMMPLSTRIYRFTDLAPQSFHGLPGMLADSLPDAFGNAVIAAWLAAQGRLPSEIDAVERLCYTGSRGMGALEFEPSAGPRSDQATPVRVDALVALAADVLRGREQWTASFADADRELALREILRVGASAGGARAKAVIAWNPTTNAVVSGQVAAPPGFEHWLLKFDGVAAAQATELAQPLGFGAIEYAYANMARAAGITTSECRMFEENGRRHFMTRRFDRVGAREKLHMQSLAALAHLDFNAAGAHSYEQALLVIRRLGLGADAVEQQFRRMVFNVVARNQDDHVKNIAFLMDKAGAWSLAPAFDLTYSHNPVGAWTAQHQMTLNAKRDGFTRVDLRAVAKAASMKRGRAEAILDEVLAVVARWTEFASAAGVAEPTANAVGSTHRVLWND